MWHLGSWAEELTQCDRSAPGRAHLLLCQGGARAGSQGQAWARHGAGKSESDACRPQGSGEPWRLLKVPAPVAD